MAHAQSEPIPLPVDVQKSRQQLQKLVEGGHLTAPVQGKVQRVAFLVFPGQFNPVHTAHLAAFDTAAQEVHRRAGVPVISGYMAPCPDQALAVEPECTVVLSSSERCAMCATVCDKSEWLALYPWGWANPSDIAEEIRRQLADQLSWTVGVRWEFEPWYLTDDCSELGPMLDHKCVPLVCVAPTSGDPVFSSIFDLAMQRRGSARQTSSAWRARRFQPAAVLCRSPQENGADCSRVRFLASDGQWERLAGPGRLDSEVLRQLQRCADSRLGNGCRGVRARDPRRCDVEWRVIEECMPTYEDVEFVRLGIYQ